MRYYLKLSEKKLRPRILTGTSWYYRWRRSNKKGLNQGRCKFVYRTITDYFKYLCLSLNLKIISAPTKNPPEFKKDGFGDIDGLPLSRLEKSNSSFAEISKILPLDDTKFIPNNEFKFKAKESQLKVYEVMESCPE